VATIYLSPTGSDSYTYAQAQNIATPWLTVAKTQASGIAGDTVILANGTYTMASVTFSKTMTYNATTNGSVTIGNASAQYYINTAGVVVTLTGIVFSGMTGIANGNFRAFAGDFVFNFCQFKNNTYGDIIYSYALFRADPGKSFTFNTCMLRNITHSTAGGSAQGIVYCDGGTATFTLNSCTWVFNVTGGSAVPRIFAFAGAGYTITEKNNIMVNSSGGTLTHLLGSATRNSTYSDYYLLTSAPTGTGVITSDPLLRDVTNFNFNLKPTSPCLGTGTNI